MENNGGGAGCYKCGRAGHWSRDCPSNPPPPTSTNPHDSNHKSSSTSTSSTTIKPKKSAPRSRPKLTPQLLLSDDGLGYVLRHFPPSFSYHAPGHEMCIRDLLHRVSNGGDPTKLRLHDYPIQLQQQETLDVEELSLFQDANPVQNHNTEDFQEAMIQEIYEKATEEPDDIATADTSAPKEVPSAALDSSSTEAPMSEEQKARIEANRLKALERAAARSRSSHAS